MKKILTALVATAIIGATALTTSDTANARWGYGGYRGAAFGGFAHRGFGYRVGYGGYGYRGYGYRGYGYRGYGYRGVGYGGYGYRGAGYGYAGYGYPYGVGTAIVVAPAVYLPVYFYGYSGCGC